MAFSVILLVIPVFCSEYQSGSRSMLLTAKRGQMGLCICKSVAAATAAFSLALAFFTVKYIAFYLLHDDFSGYPVRDIIGYSGFGELSMAGYYFSDVLIKAIAWAVTALLICVVSNLTRNIVFAKFLSFALTVCIALIPVLREGIWQYAFTGVIPAKNYTADFNICIFSFVILVKMLVYTALCHFLWKRKG